LTGELGSGKTCFVKGVAEGLGVSPSVIVNSPSFTIINQYPGRMPLYHVDLYRLSTDEDLEDLEIMDLIHGEGVTMIEWPQILMPLMGRIPLSIEFTWDMTAESIRSIVFTSSDERYDRYFETIL